MSADERLLDLVAYLLAAPRPVFAEEIFFEFEEMYAGTPEGRARKFSRDKETLRELGIPLVTTTEGRDGEKNRYSIDRSAFFLPAIDLTPDERAALFAVGAEAMNAELPLRQELAHALTKLRVTNDRGEESCAPAFFTATVRGGPIEETIVRAVTERRTLRMIYASRKTERLFDPYVFSAKRGRFSVVGFCHLSQGIRTFFSDRILSCELAHRGSGRVDFEVPSGFDPLPHLPQHPWQVRLHEPVQVELAFSPEFAESGPQALGLEPGEPCWATNLDGLVGQVLSLGAGVTIQSPARARLLLRQKLAKLATNLQVEAA